MREEERGAGRKRERVLAFSEEAVFIEDGDCVDKQDNGLDKADDGNHWRTKGEKKKKTKIIIIFEKIFRKIFRKINIKRNSSQKNEIKIFTSSK